MHFLPKAVRRACALFCVLGFTLPAAAGAG
jgi:hypothetical protein